MIRIKSSANTTQTIESVPLALFISSIEGRVVRPKDPDYNTVRAVWNGMIDKYPAMIVRCANTADVVKAVDFAREHDLLVSVRGGGHNVAGSAIAAGGMVIDLSEMTAVMVNVSEHTVIAQGGATLADLDTETQKYGLAVPGGVFSETGIGGLTLGGGLGHLRRKYGLTSDNLVGATVVTSDGQVLQVSETEHADLLWALRGGGGQFGVVTEFIYRAHKVGPELAFVFCIQPANNPVDALRFFRTFTESASNEVSVLAALGTVPHEAHFPEDAHGQPFILFTAAYAGDPVEGERVLMPLREYAKPIVDMSGIVPYVELQTYFDEDYPKHERRYYWKSTYINALSDEAIDLLVQSMQDVPSDLSTVDVWHLGGAIRDFDTTSSAFAGREADYLIGIEANWENPNDDAANIAWGRGVAELLKPVENGQRYLNFPGFLEDESLAKTMFGDSAARIEQIKHKYDPINLFRLK